MDQTLQQLGELLLGAVPTVILLALLYALYTAIVHKPLRRVLEERRSKTEGAVEKSRADIAASEARTSEYEQKLREARVAVYRAQEARRQAGLQASRVRGFQLAVRCLAIYRRGIWDSPALADGGHDGNGI